MLNERLAAELTRQRLGEPDASRSVRYVFLIPQALKATARKIAARRDLRQLLMTDKNEAILSIDPEGKLDLADLYEDYQALLEYLDYGQIYFNKSTDNPARQPAQKIPAHMKGLPQAYASVFDYYYVEGNFLYIKDEFEGGEVAFSVPRFPLTLADLPESQEVETMFLDKMVEMANPGSDLAADGEK